LRTLTIAFLTFAALSCATAPQLSPTRHTAPQIWAGLQPGAYDAGFKSWLVTGGDHPLQMDAWYPAATGGTPLRYIDYVLLSLSEKSADPLTQQQIDTGVGDFMKYLTLGGVPEEHARALADAAMYARRDAEPLAGKKFPLVYIAQGNMQTASAQAVLGEYLASHGYVVVTTPSITRLTKPMTSDNDIAPTSFAQMQDIERAVAALDAWPDVDTAVPVALAGHSFGARGALMYAMHHPSSALVSLEGGIGMATGTRAMLDDPKFDLNAQLPPVLHFYELNDARLIPDFRLLHSLRTPALELVEMKNMRHEHFTSDGFGGAMLPDIGALTKAGPNLRQDLQQFAQQTLAFLDKQTKKTP
jgi:dienelactone hydrolase